MQCGSSWVCDGWDWAWGHVPPRQEDDGATALREQIISYVMPRGSKSTLGCSSQYSAISCSSTTLPNPLRAVPRRTGHRALPNESSKYSLPDLRATKCEQNRLYSIVLRILRHWWQVHVLQVRSFARLWPLRADEALRSRGVRNRDSSRFGSHQRDPPPALVDRSTWCVSEQANGGGQARRPALPRQIAYLQSFL